MRIGIPRALLYHRYRVLWESFFSALGAEIIISPETNKELLNNGSIYAIDESCLSSKIFLGHVHALIGRCDRIFVPRIATLGDRDMFCTKFFALPDIVSNSFRREAPQILDCNIDARNGKGELSAFLELGRKLGVKKSQALYAYFTAKQAERAALHAEEDELRAELDKDGIRILVVGHSYNLRDAYIGAPIMSYLKTMGVIPILADCADRKRSAVNASALSDTLPWLCSKELVGAVAQYKDRVDGMALITAFPCGPDSLVNDILIRRVKNLPILMLTLDGQEGTAGMETRLESFIDIIRFRREDAV